MSEGAATYDLLPPSTITALGMLPRLRREALAKIKSIFVDDAPTDATRRGLFTAGPITALALSTGILIPAPARAASVWAVLETEYLAAITSELEAQKRIDDAISRLKHWEQRNPFPDAPDYTSMTESIDDHPRQLRAERQWASRYESFLRRNRIDPSARAKREAKEALRVARNRIYNTRCATIADLAEKARLSLINSDPVLQLSLAQDAMAMAGLPRSF